MSKDSRLIGSGATSETVPVVKCIGYTANPVGVLFSVWHGSRHAKDVTPEQIQELWEISNEDHPILNPYSNDLMDYLIESYPEYADKAGSDHKLYKVRYIIREVVKLSIKVDVQSSEFVSYEFKVDAASVAWREQLVRKRQTHVWTQTSRVADMTQFDATMMPTVRMMGGDEACKKYKEAVETIRKTYQELVALGVPSEDIRLQPQAHLHRVYFGCNLRNLLKLVQDRTSWIAQATLWTPVVSEIMRIMRETLGDWICDLIKPPAVVKDGKIVEYKLIADEDARYSGKDPLPVSPIYLAMKGLSNPFKNKDFYDYMKSMYINIWSDEILKAIDWDRDYPECPGRYDVGYKEGI